MAFSEIIKTWPWSSPPEVDVLLMGRCVLLTIYIGEAATRRRWAVS